MEQENSSPREKQGGKCHAKISLSGELCHAWMHWWTVSCSVCCSAGLGTNELGRWELCRYSWDGCERSSDGNSSTEVMSAHSSHQSLVTAKAHLYQGVCSIVLVVFQQPLESVLYNSTSRWYWSCCFLTTTTSSLDGCLGRLWANEIHLGKIDDVACVVILAKTFTVGVSGGHFGYEEYIESYVKM